MARFMITYLGGNQPSTPEEGKKHFAEYMEWLGSLGEAAVSPANPLKGTRTVQPDGGTAEGSVTGMSGFTVVEVESIDAAMEIAKACPFLKIGGTLEVSEMIEMPTKK